MLDRAKTFYLFIYAINVFFKNNNRFKNFIILSKIAKNNFNYDTMKLIFETTKYYNSFILELYSLLFFPRIIQKLLLSSKQQCNNSEGRQAA